MLYDPAARPVLGRLLGLDRRYRLRDPDEELDDLPGELRFKVMGELAGPLLANREALLVVTAAGRALLEGAGLEPACEARAGGELVYVFRPEDEVYPALEDEEDKPSGYGTLRASAVHLDDEPEGVARVSGTRLLALPDALAGALGATAFAGAYGPAEESPWCLVRPDDTARVARFQSPANQDALVAAYCDGALAPMTLQQDKPKASKKLLDLLSTGFLILSPTALAFVREHGVEGEEAPVTLLDLAGEPMKGGEGYALFRAPPRALIDWDQSDVNRTASGSIWGFRELVLAEDPGEAPLLAHIPGTRLHLAHQRFVEAAGAAGLSGFAFEPLSTWSHAWNLDDELTDWAL